MTHFPPATLWLQRQSASDALREQAKANGCGRLAYKHTQPSTVTAKIKLVTTYSWAWPLDPWIHIWLEKYHQHHEGQKAMMLTTGGILTIWVFKWRIHWLFLQIQQKHKSEVVIWVSPKPSVQGQHDLTVKGGRMWHALSCRFQENNMPRLWWHQARLKLTPSGKRTRTTIRNNTN